MLQPRTLPRSAEEPATETPPRHDAEVGRDVLKRLEKVLPFIAPKTGDRREADPSRRDWSDALDLVRNAADAMRAKEVQIEEVEASTHQMIERAYEEVTTFKARLSATEARCTQAELKLKAAETRLDDAEARAARAEARAAQADARVAAAESRAQEAEEWLSRIHSAVVEGFAKQG